MKTVSVIIPAYNEERFIGKLLETILALPWSSTGFGAEIIVVNDGSTDRTAEVVSSFRSVCCLSQPNRGKGAAVQTGFQHSHGDYILVQDADLEYSPADYIPMLSQLAKYPEAAVYGSRTRGQWRERRFAGGFPGKHPRQGVGPWLANLGLTFWTLVLYGRWISDTLTAYKIYPRSRLETFHVRTTGFETDHEITAKLIRAGVPIIEVPVSYEPRSVTEGKKIRFRDGLIAL